MKTNLSGIESRRTPIQLDPRIVPAWRRTPCGGNSPRVAKMNVAALMERLNEYFADCYDQDAKPTLSDMAGHAGFDSVSQMLNHARRDGGNTMRSISRGILAICANYEELAQQGNKTALALLGLMPHFDSDEPATQAPQRPFLAQKDINLNITGVTQEKDKGADLSGQEAYMRFIKNKTYEEVVPEVLETQQTNSGDYAVIDIEE